MYEDVLKTAESLEIKIIEHRRFLHQNAEVGFKLNKTVEYIKSQLLKMGYECENIGKSGFICSVGSGKQSVLLRADMDALPMSEQTGLKFASKTGNMHSCGHDMHSAMLLGAAEILKILENKLNKRICLMFQPAEERLEGALDMLQGGLLERTNPTAAVMLHIISSKNIPTGSLIVSSPGISAPSADYFEITLTGKSAHGSTPEEGIDPFIPAAHILLGLDAIKTRELALGQEAVLTVGCIEGGVAHNVISEKAVLKGTLRAYDEKVRSFVKERLVNITENMASAFRVKSTVKFSSGCPALVNDKVVSENTYSILNKAFGQKVLTTKMLSHDGCSPRGGGSEDFAYITQKVPSVMVALSAAPQRIEFLPLHHPKAVFSEEVLKIGATAYALCGIYLNND